MIDIIKSGEYDKLLSLAFQLYADGTAAVKECIKKEKIVLGSINQLNEKTPTPTFKSREQLLKLIKQKLGEMRTSGLDLGDDREMCIKVCKDLFDEYSVEMCYSLCGAYI